MSDPSLDPSLNSAPPSPSKNPLVSMAEPRDYFILLKPRVMSLVVFTALAGMLFSPHMLPFPLALISLFAIAVGAGASGALNMWYDADIDVLMSRTRNRPIPSGMVTKEEALIFGILLSFFSVLVLGFAANWLAAGWLAFTIFFYAVIYTMWLKRWTPQNIVIGGAAGALPPVVAYSAAAGEMGAIPWLLFAIIFIWTPPHFWALALVKNKDYEAAHIPMMPNIKGGARTRCEILLYSLLLWPLGMLPWYLGYLSPFYGFTACVLGILMFGTSIHVFFQNEGEKATKAAWFLFKISLIYLSVLFLHIVIERTIVLLFFRTLG